MSLIDLLFPKTCLSCNKLGKFICLTCKVNLRAVESDYCIYCRKISYLGLTHANCQIPGGIDGVMSLYEYNVVLKKIIKSIKYRLVKDAFSELFQAILAPSHDKLTAFSFRFKNYLLQPIPLHKDRYKLRGFNQSEKIAQFVQTLCHYETIDALERVKNTGAQAQIHTREERYINMKDAFIVKEEKDVRGKTIILIDDVITSGSSVKEAARVLKQSGAAHVFAFSIARG